MIADESWRESDLSLKMVETHLGLGTHNSITLLFKWLQVQKKKRGCIIWDENRKWGLKSKIVPLMIRSTRKLRSTMGFTETFMVW